MMVDVNMVMVAGRLVRDPELKYPTGGLPVCNFCVATSRKFKRSDGSKGESTLFVDVSAWRRLGEICNQFLKKGRSVLVVGTLQQNEWLDKEGKKRSKIRINADTVQFIGPRPEGGLNGTHDKPSGETEEGHEEG